MSTANTLSSLYSSLNHMIACVELFGGNTTAWALEKLELSTEDFADCDELEDVCASHALNAIRASVYDAEPLFNQDGELRRVELLLGGGGPTIRMAIALSEAEVDDIVYTHSWGTPEIIRYEPSSTEARNLEAFLELLGLEVH
jgi:hypothetical protein